MTTIAKANVGIDDLVGGNVIACPTLTALIADASTQQQQALAAELQAILDANPGDGQFTTLEVSGLSTLGPVIAEEIEIDTGTKTAAATAGAATLNKSSGVITSESLTTAGLAAYTLTLTNSKITAGDLVFAAIHNGTNTGGTPVLGTTAATANTATIVVQNVHATVAFNGTIVISFFIVKAGTPA
jgi:hypothetical protein